LKLFLKPIPKINARQRGRLYRVLLMNKKLRGEREKEREGGINEVQSG
jgi:hypothetical protein